MRRIFKVALVTVIIGSLAVGGSILWAVNQLNGIPKFESKGNNSVTKNEVTYQKNPAQSSFLLFSTGSKGLTAEDGVRLNIGRGRALMGDGLTDSIMLLLVNKESGKIGIISINRDMLINSTGRRINEAYNAGGIEMFLDQVEELTGIRPEHQIMVNFAAFSDLTDAIGGVDLQLDNGVYDSYAKLDIPVGGCIHFDGPTALAFARSRHYQIVKSDGSFSADATSTDYGRIERQQAIVRAIAQKIVGPQLVGTIPTLLKVAKSNLTFDSNLSPSALLSYANDFRAGIDQIIASTLPSHGVMLNGASVTLPEQDGIYETISKVAKNIGYTLPENWDGQYSIDTSFTIPKEVKLESKSWSPDHGNGDGGKLYKSCR